MMVYDTASEIPFEIDLPTRDEMFADFLNKFVRDEMHKEPEVREAFDVACATVEQFVQRMMASTNVFKQAPQKMLLTLFTIKLAKNVVHSFDSDFITFLAEESEKPDPMAEVRALLEEEMKRRGLP